MTATYAFRAGVGGDIERTSPLGIPTPTHALTPAAEQAREAVRRSGYDRRLSRELAGIVTDHGRPPIEPYAHPRPDAAARLEKAALAKGFRVNVFETPGRVRTVVEGFRDPVAFRAVWLRGSAESGTWHERAWRYALVDDPRAVGVSATSRLALAGKRGAGLERTHLSIIASPAGVSVGVAELVKRVSAS